MTIELMVKLNKRSKKGIIMFETNLISGPLFITGVLVALVFIAWSLFVIWSKFVKNAQAQIDAGNEFPSPVIPIVKTILLVSLAMIGYTVAWSSMQRVTTSSSGYETKEAIEYRQKAAEFVPPSIEQVDKTAADLKNRAQVQPHQKALDDFDAKMAAEAAKIKKHTSGEDVQTPATK
ncbi:MAG: hypothetical protein WCF94_01165 [bacterium]